MGLGGFGGAGPEGPPNVTEGAGQAPPPTGCLRPYSLVSFWRSFFCYDIRSIPLLTVLISEVFTASPQGEVCDELGVTSSSRASGCTRFMDAARKWMLRRSLTGGCGCGLVLSHPLQLPLSSALYLARNLLLL